MKNLAHQGRQHLLLSEPLRTKTLSSDQPARSRPSQENLHQIQSSQLISWDDLLGQR